MITKGDIPKLLTAGMKTEFMGAYEKATSDYDRITTTLDSKKSEETYPFLGAVPKMKEWKDERKEEDLTEYYFTVSNYSWESTISVDRDAIEDEKPYYCSSINSVNSEEVLRDYSEPSPWRGEGATII